MIARTTLTRLLLLSAVALRANAQGAHGYLYIVGSDTIGVERVTTSPTQVAASIAFKGQPRIEWSAPLDARGSMGPLSLAAYRTGTTDTPLQRATLELVGDSVRLSAAAGSAPLQSRMIGTKRGAFLLQNNSIEMMGFMIGRARSTPAPIDTIPVFLAIGGQTIDAEVRTSNDSTWISLAGMVSVVQSEPTGTIRSVFIQAQNLRVTRVSQAVLSTVNIGAPDYSAPAGAPYSAEHVMIPARGGHTMAATLTRPTGVAAPPVVITISGSGAQERDGALAGIGGYAIFRQIADTLGRRGVAVLRFDDRGVGASTGNHTQATSADFADDVRSMVEWLRKRTDIDPQRIFLLGHSEGGLIAPMVASTDSKLAGIILLAGPAKTGRDILAYQIRYAVDHSPELASATVRDSAFNAAMANFSALPPTAHWMRFFVGYDPIPTARQVRVPTLILQGETDRQVTPDQATTLATAIRSNGNRAVTVHLLPNRNHLFLEDADGNPGAYVKLVSGRIPSDVMGKVIDWLATVAQR